VALWVLCVLVVAAEAGPADGREEKEDHGRRHRVELTVKGGNRHLGIGRARTLQAHRDDTAGKDGGNRQQQTQAVYGTRAQERSKVAN
jgi:hypothetical protein